MGREQHTRHVPGVELLVVRKMALLRAPRPADRPAGWRGRAHVATVHSWGSRRPDLPAPVALDVDDVIAHLLVTEGFTSVEEVAFVPVEELASVEGFDEDVAGELQERARTFLKEQNERFEKRRQELGVSDEIAAIEGMTPAILVAVGEKGVKTLDDLADLAADELIEMAGGAVKLEEEEANAIIMAARAHWFEDEAPAAAPEAE